MISCHMVCPYDTCVYLPLLHLYYTYVTPVRTCSCSGMNSPCVSVESRDNLFTRCFSLEGRVPGGGEYRPVLLSPLLSLLTAPFPPWDCNDTHHT